MIKEGVEIHDDLKTALAHIDDSFFTVDGDWRCVYANNKAAHLAGRDWHEMVGRPIRDLFREVIGSHGFEILRTVMEQRRFVAFEYFLKNSKQWVEHRAYPCDYGLAVFSIDITERKAVEIRCLETEQRLLATCDNAPVGIAETDGDGRYLRVNRKWCEITGYSAEELLQRKFIDLTHPDDANIESLKYIDLFKSSNPGYDVEKRYLRKDGSIVWVRVRRTAVRRPDGSVFGIGSAEDITRRKIAEQDLQKAQAQLRRHAEELEAKVAERTAELEKSNKAMEGFCYSIAHDLRTPVRAMRGLTQALTEDYGSQLNSTGKEFTVRINQACERMDCLIQDLLAFGELTHMQLPTETIELEEIAGNVTDRFHSEIQASGARIEIVTPLGSVKGNPIILTQIVSNLLSNALTFVDEDVQPQIRIWTERLAGRVKLFVKDNGIGIAPEYHEKIFRLFETIQPIGNYAGTGIGLALVKQGAERIGGTVGVDSKPGQGSTFWVDLPAP